MNTTWTLKPKQATMWIKLRHSRGVTLSVFWDLSSWAEEEEEAALRHSCSLVWEPVQVFWGWAEAARWLGRGFWEAGGCAAVWIEVGEDRCGPPAAAGGGDGDGADADADGGGGCAGEDAAVEGWSNPNEAPPHPLSAGAFSVCYRCSKQ